jgi:hypothetical protein
MKIIKFREEDYPHISSDKWYREVMCLYCNKMIPTKHNVYVIQGAQSINLGFFGICSETCVNLYILTHQS